MIKIQRRIYIILISENFDEENFKFLIRFVSQQKGRQIEELNNCIDKKVSLYAQIAVKLIIQNEFNIPLENLSIGVNDFGKPYLVEYPDIFFNISHSNNAIVIGFSENPVGIDIEFESDKNFIIAKRFFTKKECEYIQNNSQNHLEAFYEIWTKKEAYIKCLGLGLGMPLKHFCVMSEKLTNLFITIKKWNYIISFYDSTCNDYIDLKELSEKEIEQMKLSN